MPPKKTTPGTLGKNFYHKRGRPSITRIVQEMDPSPAAGALGEFLKLRAQGDLQHPWVKEVRRYFESSYLLKWVRGKARPSYDQAYLLEELSHGAVKLADWVVPKAVEVLRKEPNPRAAAKWADTMSRA